MTDLAVKARRGAADRPAGPDAAPPGEPAPATDGAGLLVCKWDRNFERLAAFHRLHGHCDVPCNGRFASLYEWLRGQRLLNRHHRLLPERRRRLDELGYNWAGHRLQGERSWDRQFDRLVAFQRAHGHLDVPSTGATAHLRNWVSEQRQAQASGELSQRRQQRLAAIHFPWAMPLDYRDRAWNMSFAMLVEFRRTHGRFPGDGCETWPEKRLYRWIRMQCLQHRLQRLRPDRQQRLTAAGFPWDPPERVARTAKLWGKPVAA
jgi:hypothetical protein